MDMSAGCEAFNLVGSKNMLIHIPKLACMPEHYIYQKKKKRRLYFTRFSGKFPLTKIGMKRSIRSNMAMRGEF